MTFATAQNAAAQAERLLEIFKEIGANQIAVQGVEAGTLALWEILESLVSPGDPHDPLVSERHIRGAGLHDLAAKVVHVWDTFPAARGSLEPHLKLLAQTYHIGQNSENERWDRIGGVAREHGSADKVIELYWGALCLAAGLVVEFDDPFESSGGTNPDIIATAADTTRWAFALKTLQKVADTPKVSRNLAANIAKGIQQIERSGCEKGIVVVNLKNVLDRTDLNGVTFPDWTVASDLVDQKVQEILNSFYANEVQGLISDFSSRGPVAPIVIILAHVTVLSLPPMRHTAMFTELKKMYVAGLPRPDEAPPGTYGAEATAFATALHHLVQVII